MSNWTVAYASVIGNMHVQLKLPCQDTSTYEAINENWGVAVVCDGAGSATHSHLGSETTAILALRYFKELVVTQGWHESGEFPSEMIWKGSAIVALRKIREGLGKLAEAENVKIGALGSTIIVVIHSPEGLLVTHIGDGRAGYSNGTEWISSIKPFQGAEANETVFITSYIWDENEIGNYARTHIIKDKVVAFTLLTDGCEKSSFEVNIFNPLENKFFDLNKPFPKFFEPNVQGLKMLRKEGKTQAEINKLWGGFLTNGTAQFKTETDDKTMILGVLCEVENEVNKVENLQKETSDL